MSKSHNILPTKTSFFVSSAGQNWNGGGIQNEFFWIAVSLQMVDLKIIWLHVVVFTEYDIAYFWGNVYL